jgi:putative transposase
MEEDIYKTSPHKPPHLFISGAVYMVTGATLFKTPILRTDKHKLLFCNTLFERAETCGWELHAWAILDNHYHFVAQSPANAQSLVRFIRELHSITAIAFNHLDGVAGRRVWYNYWNSCITYETSYLARLHYVHQNPVKHGVIARAEDYPYCSYRWFIANGEPELQRKVFEQPVDRIRVEDDF